MNISTRVLGQTFGENYALYHGDCVDVTRGIPDASIHFSVFSPPFSNLYIYSESERDLGNAVDDNEFFTHFDFLIPELLRVTLPGRLCAVHCKDLVNYIGRDGAAGLRDFSGELIRHFSKAGWQYHSKVVIWKDPVIERARTEAHGLLYKTLRADSTFCRQGLPEYMLIFRKWARTEEETAQIVPVTHTREGFPLSIWQRYASPVWFDIRQTNVLNVDQARANQDEKHICLARGSLVLTRDGYLPIEEVSVGDLVLTHRGRWQPVLAKVCNGDKPVIRTTAQGVADLRLTPEHKLWTRRGTTFHPRLKAKAIQPEWVAASETLGSYVNLKLPPIEDSPYSAEEWWIVGRWLSDGHFDTRGRAHISCGDAKRDSLVTSLRSRCGAVTQVRTGYQVALNDRGGKLRELLRRCGHGAGGKRLPAEAVTLNEEKSEALLAGYLSGDGHYVEKYERWTATSVSRALLLGMAMVAQRARGVVASVYAGRPEGETTIEGRLVRTRQEWILSIPPRNLSGMMLEDGAWKKVRDIQPVGEAEVWDIQVAEDASFTAEGCIVHNCPLQLDVIARCIELWSNPGETVLSPFAGIGSEGYEALRHGRKFIGIELKDTYFHAAKKNLDRVLREKTQATLWDTLPLDEEPVGEERDGGTRCPHCGGDLPEEAGEVVG